MILNILIIAVLVTTSYGIKSYENYKVYNVYPKSELDVERLNGLKNEEYDFWTDVVTVGNPARIMVSPAQDASFVSYMRSVGLAANVSIPNVKKLMDAQMQPASNADRSARLGSFSWDRYYNLQQIHAWLDELVTLYPGVVSTQVIGRSLEGREIKGVIIDFREGQRGENPRIAMIEGGIHAREWISPATVTWIIKEFLTSNDPEVRALAENFIWHIFPVVNPDGYSYTFAGDRMWRKNRNPANRVECTEDDNDLGNGIDLNRNFDYVWMTVGASSNPCSRTYAGPSPSSELEAQAIMQHVLSLKQKGNFLYYFAFHSYSQMILIPYSHVKGHEVLQASNYADMYEIAIYGAEKLKQRHGTAYKVGTSAEILYPVSGASFDWVKGVADIPIVYLFELRDVGEYGFMLPPEEIIPNNEEIMDCLLEMDKATRFLNYYERSGTNAVYISVMTLFTNLVFLVLFK
ncbi:zinc carboxypeptidase-like [Manduca sexta]|uniref:zinc carboxypeptidase-like n=1 Tax=Manduca sexta TaxID=7130 RepID=UPI0018906D6C|nr:zinc carboxypeptidase-like [Manduca sexta]